MTRTIILVLVGLLSSELQAQLFQKVHGQILTAENQKSFGTAWVDYDNDDDLDLFVVNMGADNVLYRNDGDAAFTRMKQSDVGSLVADGGNSFTMSWADFNRDGLLDVFVGNFGEPSFLYAQNKDHQFIRVQQALLGKHAVAAQGSSWVDFDLDGDLDLFVGTKEEPNLLFENDSKGAFQLAQNTGFGSGRTDSHGPAWSDFNGDKYPDLFLAENVESDNLLYLNHRGTMSLQAHGDSKSVSIGASWVDYDNDLDMDLFVTNAMGKPDYLYENIGGELKLVENNGIDGLKTNSMGACWGDYDNDGDQDVFVANAGNQRNSLFLNNGNGQFEGTGESWFEGDKNASRGCSAGDYDNDGDLDLYITNGFGQKDNNEFYQNNGNRNNWVKLKLTGRNNATPIGTRVIIHTAAGSQMRELSSQTGAYGHNSYEIHFGIGDAAQINELTIQWGNGQKQSFKKLKPNVSYKLKEGDRTLR